MAIIYWLIPLSIIVLCLAVAVFLWAIQNGQYDDLESAGSELLFDEPVQPENDKCNPNANN